MSDEEFLDPIETGDAAPVTTDPSESAVVAALQQERDELRDRLLRQAAEFDNYRKRVDRERRAQADQAVVNLLLELLSVVDDFDLALNVAGDDTAGGYRKGVELIHAKLHEVLRKQGVAPVAAVGQMFNPNVHEAVTHEASPGHKDGEVVAELRRGYTLGERLLRPAMVKVARA